MINGIQNHAQLMELISSKATVSSPPTDENTNGNTFYSDSRNECDGGNRVNPDNSDCEINP